MKTTTRKILTAVAALLVLNTLAAQTDTIYGFTPRYHYSELYDTIPYYPDTCRSNRPFYWFPINNDSLPVAKEQLTPAPIAVKGIAIMVSMNRYQYFEPYNHQFTPGSPKLPEYAYLAHYESVGSGQYDMVPFSDSLRWDTAAPKVMVLPFCGDSTGCCTYDCYVYEVFFKNPVIADSSFYIVCTENSNREINDIAHAYHWFPYTPTLLSGVGGPHITKTHDFIYQSSHYWQIQETSHQIGRYWGGFFPIVDYFTLEARPEEACDTMGTVTGSGRFTDYAPRRITAVPNRGYWFRQWNDGDTTNPRIVYLTQDTLFTATFTASLPCRADALTQDSTHGTVTGSGNYFQGDTVTFTAYPNVGYTLLQWSDGSTRNPYRFTITHDTTLTATFRQLGYYRVDVATSDHSRGYVTGGGNYWELDTVTLNAFARSGYDFLQWNDSVTDNPRTIVVMQDTAFTAYFSGSEPEGINAPDAKAPLFTLTPNPAHNSVTVTVNPQLSILDSQLSITLTDAAGRELYSTKISNLNSQISILNYPAGTYFVTLRTPDTASTQRLVIE